jgi:hypothetical protein
VIDAREAVRRRVLSEVEQALRGDDADDVLREVVTILQGRLEHVAYAGIAFVEGPELVVGPAAGERAGAATESWPVAFRGSHVADLEVAGELDDGDRALLEQVAPLISPHCLVGWDTGGEEWQP